MFRIVAVLSAPDNRSTEALVRHAGSAEGIQGFILAEIVPRQDDLTALQVYYVSDNTMMPDYP